MRPSRVRARTHPRSRGEGGESGGGPAVLADSPPLARGRRTPGRRNDSGDGLTPARAGKALRRGCRAPRSRTHPRSRGEGSWEASSSASVLDSPPLARGRRGVLVLRVGEPGLTPARAGKAGTAAGSRPSPWTHPRSRGEGNAPSPTVSPPTDSPPLARGRHRDRDEVLHGLGLTPARAGKAWSMQPSHGPVRTHPRSRGEGPCSSIQNADSSDSPPLARGRLGR